MRTPNKKNSDAGNSKDNPVYSTPNMERLARGLMQAARKSQPKNDLPSSDPPISEDKPVYSSPNVERAIRGLNEAARKHQQQKK